MQPPRDPSTGPKTLQKRPTTPGRSPSKENSPPSIPDLPPSRKDEKKEKRSSLAFLRRSKSSEGRGNLKPLVPNIPQQAPKIPDLWNGSTPPQPLKTFGGAEIRDSMAIVGGLDIPGMSSSRRSIDTGVSGASSLPEPGRSSGKDSIEEETQPLNAATSITQRGRYAFASAGSAVSSPRRVRRRKDPTPFNILVIGARNSGKTSFIQFLQQSLAIKSKHDPPMESTPEDAPVPSKSPFAKTYLETEIDGERIGLTLWDSQGFEKNLVDLQLRQTIAFIESKFEDTFTEETKVVRSPGVKDTHIHCAFHLIDPARLESSIVRASISPSSANGNILSGGLDEDLDLQVLRGLRGKTTVVPVISKADTITTAHMNVLKHLVRTSLKNQGLDPLETLDIDLEAYGITPSPIPPNMYTAGPDMKERKNWGKPTEENGIIEEDEEDDDERSPRRGRPLSRASLETTSTSASDNSMTNVEFLPLSVISPDSYEPGAIGRKFPWGFADPFNAEHCDFVRLKEAVFSEWRGELRESSREIWYENWRTSRLSGSGGIGNGAGRKGGAKRR